MSFIRTATLQDLPAIMRVLAAGRGIMLSSGNRNQWPAGYPTEDMVRKDIRNGYGKVLEEAGRVTAYFACIPSPDPTYSYIEDGKWIDDQKPYYVIHRLAKLPGTRGVFAKMMDYLDGITDNIRIDTHRDNAIMQHLIMKHGFGYCGVIYLADGQPRLAYQRLR